MEKKDIIQKVKVLMGIEGDYQDELLEAYMDEVLNYMESAGVKKSVIQNIDISGVIARGILDLWNYTSGSPRFSGYFFQRVSQLVLEGEYMDDGF